MATRDILVLNTTASRAETQQGSDTVVIRGNSGEALSVENSSGTSILSVNTVSSSVDVAGKITATTNVSSSITSTGSFGRVEATTLVGDAFNLTNTAIDGTISSSGQIANQISGAFRQGFEFEGTIGSVAGHTTTASFDRIVATVFSGSAANLTNVALEGTLSSSAQIASQISGAFTRGFEFTGTISGSATSTGSFGQIFAKKAVGDVSAMTNLIPTNTVSGSAQLATKISGAFDAGFEYEGTISGSVTSTGSFSNIQATTVVGDVSAMTGLIPSGIISSSAQIASRVSGSFNKGFEFDGTISNTPLTFTAGGAMINVGPPAAVYVYHRGGAGNKNAGLYFGGMRNPGSAGQITATTEEYNGTSFSEVNDMNNDGSGGGAGTSEAALMTGGHGRACDTEEYNGTNWSQVNDMNIDTWCYAPITFGASSEAVVAASGGDSPYTQTETWNGTNWSTANQMINDARFWIGGTGTSNAGITVGGVCSPSPQNTKTELWNGTNWSAGPNTTIDNMKLTGLVGSQNDALTGGHLQRSNFDGNLFSNYPNASGRCSIRYDGTSWSAAGDLGMGCSDMNMMALTGIGQSVDVGMFGGGLSPHSPHYHNNTFEVTDASIITGSFGRVEVTSISGDGSNLTNSALAGTISSSGQIASQISGAFTSGFTVSGDITTKDVVFSSGGDLNCTADDNMTTYRGAAGNKNAGLIYGGYKFGYGPAFREQGCTEEYDGTTWTEKNDMIDSGGTSGGGTTEAAIATGGVNRCGCTEYWNGTNWSEVNDQILNNLNTSTFKTLSIGQSSDAIVITGFDYQSPYGHTEEWNGTNWATANRANHSVKLWHGGAGTANAGLTAGGPYGSNVVSCTEEWNGTNWTEGPSALISNMKAVSMAGSQNDTLLAGFVQTSTFQPNNLLNNPNTNSADTICWNGISWATSATLGVRRFGMSAAGQNSNVAFFASGLENASPYKAECTIEVETFVATASFSHIEALRITGSVDQMTNINPPEGAISGAAQIASYVSGSFNKGFEFSGELRSLGAWSQGADFTGCYSSTYGKRGYSAIGTRDAAIVAGAYGVYEGWVSETYAYNGIAWSDTGHHLIQGGSHSAHGTANAGLAIGRFSRAPGTGYFYTCTEEYNGSAWSETTDLPYKLKNLNNQSAGTQNAALTAGGNCDAGNDLDAIKRHALAWDGLSYSHVGTLAEARDSAALVGTMNAALAQGGGSDSSTNDMASDSTCTEEWNGSAWSTAAASNFPTGCGVMASGKSSNDSMHVYDATNASQKSDVYNGTTWNLGPNMIGENTIQDYGAAGTTAKSFFMARISSAVEHFDEYTVTSSIGRVDANELSLESDTDLTVNESLQIPLYAGNPEVTSSAGEVWYNTAEEKLYFTYDINSWSEITDMIQGKTATNIVGHAGEILSVGGQINNTNPYQSQCTELWNGTTWTEVNDTIEAQSGGGMAGNACAGILMSTGYGQATEGNELWNGTNWSAGPDGGIHANGGVGTTGTANASLHAGGTGGSGQSLSGVVEWNGTSFYTGGSMPTARGRAGHAGTQNATYVFGGGTWAGPPAAVVTSATTEKYNGTSWATDVNLPIVVRDLGGSGTSNASLASGGGNPGAINTTMEYNGSAWTTTNNLNTARSSLAGDGSQSSTLVAGGSDKCADSETYTTTGIGCHCIGGV